LRSKKKILNLLFQLLQLCPKITEHTFLIILDLIDALIN